MAIVWQQGKDAEGHWICADGEVHVPSIHWQDGDPPERYRYWAQQAREMAQSEREQIARLERLARVHELQAEAYAAIAEVLALGQPDPVITIRPERPILPRPPEGDGDGE